MTTGQHYKNYPFRFCNVWASDDRFFNIVSNVWATNIQGCHMYRLVTKLKLLRIPLRELHRFAFSKLSEQVIKAREEMLKAQELVQADHTDIELVRNMKHYKDEYSRVASAELSPFDFC